MPNNQSVCQQQQQPQQSTGGCAVGAASDGSSIQQHQPQSSQQLITSASTATTNTNNNTNNSHDNNNNNNNNNNSVTTTTTTNNNNNSNPTATTTTTTTGSSNNNNNNNKTVAAGSDYLRPCVALSQRIMPVYRHINSVYSEERRRRQPGPKYNDGYDDRHGHYLVFTGEIIWGRYTVQGVLGRGSFGTVLKCFDEKHQEQVAAKVIRNGEYFYSQGLMEVDIVARLNSIPPLENLVVRLGKVFLWKGHLVLVFEMLSMNLFQLIQRTNYNGVSLDLTRKFAYQLILVLKQLEEHDPPIIHCDVKPENVVLRDPSRSSIRLIDFGSACYLHQGAKLYKYVQSRFYRSVEVILELGYDTAIDRWSLGCMLVELHTGVPLFAGKNEADQLARFVAVLGPVPDEMIGRSPKKDVFFVDCRRAQQQGGSPAMTDHHHNNNNHNQQQQKRGHAASPSPVIEAEVLHSLSATSSISVLTAESAATMWPYAPQADAAGTAVAAPPPPQQQQQHVGGAETTGGVGAAEGRQMYGNSSSAAGNNTYVNNNTNTNNNNNNNNNATNSNNAVTAVPALHRPRTAFTTTSSSARKENNAGYTTVSSGGGFFTPNVARKGSKYSTSGNHQIQPKSFLSTNTTASASASAPMPMTTLQARSSAQLRYSVFTPRSRLPSSSSNNHPAPHDDGSSSSLPTSATGRRVNMQQTTSAPGETRETSSPPLKSPFALRFPLASEQYQSLEDIIGVYSGGPRGCRQRQAGHGVDDYKVFLDFVQRLLCYDPRKRMTCTEALQHPFLSELEMQKQWRYLSGGGAS